jgi:hypothetical protein
VPPASTLPEVTHPELPAGGAASDPSVSGWSSVDASVSVWSVSGWSSVDASLSGWSVSGWSVSDSSGVSGSPSAGVEVSSERAVVAAAVVLGVVVLDRDVVAAVVEVDSGTDDCRVLPGDSTDSGGGTARLVRRVVVADRRVVIVALVVVRRGAPVVGVGSTAGAFGTVLADGVGVGSPANPPIGKGGVTERPERPAPIRAR